MISSMGTGWNEQRSSLNVNKIATESSASPAEEINLMRDSVIRILQELGWRTLEQRREDACLCLFYKIVYDMVAVPLPAHVQYSNRVSRYCHSMTFRQSSTLRGYYK